MPSEECEHSFQYLRQEETNIGYDRNPLWLIQDVYFCSKCLTYQKVNLREETPSRESFGLRDVQKRYV